jgi:hypothetical protein
MLIPNLGTKVIHHCINGVGLCWANIIVIGSSAINILVDAIGYDTH